MFAASAAILLSLSGTQAREVAPIKIGFITTLSTPDGYIGEDLRDGFQLAMTNGKLGNVPVQIEIRDDAMDPGNAKRAAEAMIQSGVKLFTGVGFSNVLDAVVPSVLESGGLYVSLSPGPSAFAGAKCHPNYFVASYQDDTIHEAAGLSANNLGYKRVVLVAQDNQTGRYAMEGFKRAFSGRVIAELHTQPDQIDFSIELGRIHTLAPDAVYQFHPGKSGIRFMTQYANTDLDKSVAMLIPSSSMDAHMIEATGAASEGIYASAIWTTELDNAASTAFVSAFHRTYARTPTLYAQQAYDTANLIGSALKRVEGNINETSELRKALFTARFTAVRGGFAFGANQHPIQDYYLTRFERGSSGKIVQQIVHRVAAVYGDKYAGRCRLD
ncbi:ABC transporter substrate-binding protein [Ensifer sp. ENS05]|nr:ABC transporter substrate-binding protein [Ensifer sp. ENS05]